MYRWTSTPSASRRWSTSTPRTLSMPAKKMPKEHCQSIFFSLSLKKSLPLISLSIYHILNLDFVFLANFLFFDVQYLVWCTECMYRNLYPAILYTTLSLCLCLFSISMYNIWFGVQNGLWSWGRRYVGMKSIIYSMSRK